MVLVVRGIYDIQMTLESCGYCYYITKFPNEVIYKANGYDDAISKLNELTKTDYKNCK